MLVPGLVTVKFNFRQKTKSWKVWYKISHTMGLTTRYMRSIILLRICLNIKAMFCWTNYGRIVPICFHQLHSDKYVCMCNLNFQSIYYISFWVHLSPSSILYVILYSIRMSFAKLLLDSSKTSLSWQTSKAHFKRYRSMLLF